MAPFLLSEAIGPSSGERRRSQSILQSGRDPSSKLTGGNVRVVVTGGAGYIGSTAVARLVARGDDVVAIDNLTQGHQQALPDSVPLVPIDICDRSAIASALHEHRPDAVLHFAALTIAPESVRDPAPYWRVNTGGTLNVLDAMCDAGVPTIVFSSTAAVYGTTEQITIPEDAPLQPINPCGASKRAAERAVASYAEAYRLAYAALRYFNVAGAAGEVGEDHRPETHLIPSALDAAAGWRDPLSVFGTDFPTAGAGPRCCWRQLTRLDQSGNAGRCLGARSSRCGRARDGQAGAYPVCRTPPRRSGHPRGGLVASRNGSRMATAALESRRDGFVGLELAAAIPPRLRDVGRSSCLLTRPAPLVSSGGTRDLGSSRPCSPSSRSRSSARYVARFRSRAGGYSPRGGSR